MTGPKKDKKCKPRLTAAQVYYGSNSGATQALYHRLEQKGSIGVLAANLMRVQKSSSRAKVYRGHITHHDGQQSSFRSLAYERKNQCLMAVCDVLMLNNCGLLWGWKQDPRQEFATHVVYIDLPQGQVSFHSTERYRGPDYQGESDGDHKSEERILAFCDSVMAGSKPESQPS